MSEINPMYTETLTEISHRCQFQIFLGLGKNRRFKKSALTSSRVPIRNCP